MIPIPTETKNKREMKKKIGDFVVESILESVSERTSPVSGARYWKKKLSKPYKKIKAKIAIPTANMELHGKMLDSLVFKQRKDAIEVGIFKFKEAQKSDNHNKFSSASKKTKVPERQFIPRPGQKFKKPIMTGINDMLQRNIVQETEGDEENDD